MHYYLWTTAEIQSIGYLTQDPPHSKWQRNGPEVGLSAAGALNFRNAPVASQS